MSYSALQLALAKGSPAGLASAVDPSFELTAHLNVVDQALVEAIADAEGARQSQPRILLVSMPPRHGKSTLISVYTPAWYLGLFPTRRVILASYEADFAASWGMRARDLLAEHGEGLYGVGLSRAARAARRWDLGQGGGMITAGVGGAITGRGAHLLIIDDPVKCAETAMSAKLREKQWEWWAATARSRLEPGAVVVVLMTRWHQADLGGKLSASSAQGGDPVQEIRLPALAEASDPLGREPGEALWPERYSAAWFEKTRETVGAYWFSAMYQGRPTPDEGGIFSRQFFRYFEEKDGLLLLREADGESPRLVDPGYCRKATYVDLAVSERESADYTVLVDVLVSPEGDLLVDKVIRKRIPGSEQPQFLSEHYSRTGAPLKIESIGYQASLIQTLQRAGVAVEPVYPDKDKVTRASAAGALYRSGKVFHRAGAGWLHDFEVELLAFPAGEHDDQVDALAYAARDLPGMVSEQRLPRSGGGTILGPGFMDRAL